MKRRVLSILVATAISAPLMGANYLIVSSEAMKPGYEELKKFRESPEGGSYNVSVVTVESLGLSPIVGPPLEIDPWDQNEPPYPDDDYFREINTRARTIRSAIYDFWKTRTNEENYVVLVGRADTIPPVQVFPTGIKPDPDELTTHTGIPSDLYYAVMRNLWEPEATQRFFPANPIPKEFFTADLLIGRLPMGNALKVRQYVDRMRRYMAEGTGLAPNSILLHGTMVKEFKGEPFGKNDEDAQYTDGYPWLDDKVNHPRAKLGNKLPDGKRILDAEVWMRNTFLKKIAPYETPEKKWRVDLFFDLAAGDPLTRNSFTDRYSIENPKDIDVYLHEAPELVLMSAHGFSEGSAKVSSFTTATPGNRWGFMYSTACNTATFDSYAIRGGTKKNNAGNPPLDVRSGKWDPFVMAEMALNAGDDTYGGLAYAANTRQGFSEPAVGGYGDYSTALLATFAEQWAKHDDWTVGQMFKAHKDAMLYRLGLGYSGNWRSLLAGTTLMGDPALRPMRAVPAFYHQPFVVTLSGLGNSGDRQVECFAGRSIDEQITEEPTRPGKVFVGWTKDGVACESQRPLPYVAEGMTLVAQWRDARPEELNPMAYEQASSVPFSRKIYLSYDTEPANADIPRHSGSARAVSKKHATDQKFFEKAAATPLVLTFWTYHKVDGSMFDGLQLKVMDLLLPGNQRITFLRQTSRGYTWNVNGQDVAAATIISETWVNHTLVVNSVLNEQGEYEGHYSFYHDGVPYEQVPNAQPISLPGGRGTLYLGGGADEIFKYVQGFQWLDEPALFVGNTPGAVGDYAIVKELASRAVPELSASMVLNGSNPTRLPDASVFEENQIPDIVIRGSGTLQLTGGQTLPPLQIGEHVDISAIPPSSGVTTMTEETRDRLGFGGLIWTGLPVPELGWAQVGAVNMKITNFVLSDQENMQIDLQLSSPETEVRFAPNVPSRNFTLVPFVTRTDTEIPPEEKPASVQIDGSKATLSLPRNGESKNRLFRVRYSSAPGK